MSHEIPWFVRRTGTPTPSRRAASPRGASDRGGRRLPRRPSHDRLTLGGRLSRSGCGRSGGRLLAGPTVQVDLQPREGDPPVVGRPADRTWVPDRSLDRAEGGPHDPPGVRRRPQPQVPDRLAPASRLHPAKAPPNPSRTRPGGNRRVASLRLAAHQKKPGGNTPILP